MTPLSGPLARLDRSKEALAKEWLVRLIQRSSLEEIQDLPTESIAREVPQLIGDVLRACNGDRPFEISAEGADRAAALAALRGRRERAAGELSRDFATLHAVLVRGLHGVLDEADTDQFAELAEKLAEAMAVIQATAVETLIRDRWRELESQANTDPLTGLWNLRYLNRQFAQLLDVQKRYGRPFSVLVIDIDGLKRVNDAHGHQAGDRVLMQVAVSLRRSVRSVDTAARLGGDEFCVLAPEQDARGGVVLGQRLADAAREDVLTPEAPPIGLSIGVVSCPEHGDDSDALMELADRAMYRAKAAGEAVAMGGDGSNGAVAEGAKS
jgi:diguanylate cyclase (GGDEF)-like protein